MKLGEIVDVGEEVVEENWMILVIDEECLVEV